MHPIARSHPKMHAAAVTHTHHAVASCSVCPGLTQRAPATFPQVSGLLSQMGSGGAAAWKRWQASVPLNMTLCAT